MNRIRLLVLAVMIGGDAWWWHSHARTAAPFAARVWTTLLAGGGGVTLSVIGAVAVSGWVMWGFVYRKEDRDEPGEY